MSRSLKKGPYADSKLLAKVGNLNEKGRKEVVKTWSRASNHLPRDGGSHNSGA